MSASSGSPSNLSTAAWSQSISGRERRLPYSSVRQHIRCTMTAEGKERTQCLVKNCDSTLSGSTSTSTLRKHLEKHSIFLSDRTEKRLSLDRTITAEPRTAIEHVQAAIETQLCHWIVISMQSFATVQHDHFIKRIAIANPSLQAPSRQKISRRLKTMCAKKKLDLMSALEMAKSRVSVTADVWSPRVYTGYMVVTGHWVD